MFIQYQPALTQSCGPSKYSLPNRSCLPSKFCGSNRSCGPNKFCGPNMRLAGQTSHASRTNIMEQKSCEPNMSCGSNKSCERQHFLDSIELFSNKTTFWMQKELFDKLKQETSSYYSRLLVCFNISNQLFLKKKAQIL